jgi:serine/threonine-protein kinase
MPSRKFVARVSVALACGALSVAAFENAARAEASLADKAAAQSLFDEGRKLMSAGKFAEACPKLAESQKLDPGVGTQFNLADCYEKIGQTASAWAGFLEAASAAKSMGQADREKVARDRAAALAPRLSKLTITSTEAATLAGLEIKRDGAPVGRALWGTAIAVDPGSHVIEATAPGKKGWQTTAKIEGDKASVVVSIPPLEDAPVQAQTAPKPEGERTSVELTSDGSGRRTLGIVVAGVGVVGLGIATGFALAARANNEDSFAHCDAVAKNTCLPEGLDLRNDARTQGNVATISTTVGLVALAAGAVLYFTAPSREKAAVVVPTAGPGTAGLAFVGRY